MTLNDLITAARDLASRGCSYSEACELLTRDLGRPMTTDERQEVWAATDGDGDTPAQATKPTPRILHELTIRTTNKQRFRVIEFVEWRNDRRKALHTVYVRETPLDLIVWTADFLATGKVPQAALMWHTPGVGR